MKILPSSFLLLLLTTPAFIVGQCSEDFVFEEKSLYAPLSWFLDPSSEEESPYGNHVPLSAVLQYHQPPMTATADNTTNCEVAFTNLNKTTFDGPIQLTWHFFEGGDANTSVIPDEIDEDAAILSSTLELDYVTQSCQVIINAGSDEQQECQSCEVVYDYTWDKAYHYDWSKRATIDPPLPDLSFYSDVWVLVNCENVQGPGFQGIDVGELRFPTTAGLVGETKQQDVWNVLFPLETFATEAPTMAPTTKSNSKNKDNDSSSSSNAISSFQVVAMVLTSFVFIYVGH